LSLLPLASGCAVDGFGAVAARATAADEAVVIDIYTIGAQLRTRPDDAGLGVGWARRSYVFDAAEARGVAPGWHYFSAPLPRWRAAATYGTQLGLDLDRDVDRVGITLGLRSRAAIAPVPSDQAAVVELDFRPSAPERTRLRSCFGEEECADYFLQR
jgi:hypothetical protein